MEFITSGDRIATENFSIGKIYTVTFTNGNYFINTCVGIGPDFVMFQQEAPKMLFCLDMDSAETVSSIDESGGGSGTNNYNELDNKPSINGVTLIGNKTAADLSILPVPIVGENDNNKILTASYSGGVGSYSWQPAPSSGTSDYTQLTNKPQINSVELNGNKSLSDLGIASAEALAGKQDIISDLSTIRSGAAAGATAVQPATLDGYQPLINDLSTIRSGAAAGATAVQPATLAGYQTLIDSTHKLSSDLVDDTGHTNKFATAAQLAQIETNKTNILTVADSGGVKNMLPVNAATSALNYFDITVNIKAGTYVVYFGSVSTTYTSATEIQVAFYKVPDRIAFTGVSVGTNTYAVVTIPEDIEVVRVYPTANATTSSGYSVTFSNMMLCTKAAWDVSHTYQPYAMTNAEITAWILAQT